jgi:hypothetical protein
LDWPYLSQDTFVHDLMKLFRAVKEIGKNYRLLEEFLDLMIRTFHITEDTWIPPIVLHQNHLRPMFEK